MPERDLVPKSNAPGNHPYFPGDDPKSDSEIGGADGRPTRAPFPSVGAQSPPSEIGFRNRHGPGHRTRSMSEIGSEIGTGPGAGRCGVRALSSWASEIGI